jgi:hypothetical protein
MRVVGVWELKTDERSSIIDLISKSTSNNVAGDAAR